MKDAEDRDRLEYIQANLNTTHLTAELEKYRNIDVTAVCYWSPYFSILKLTDVGQNNRKLIREGTLLFCWEGGQSKGVDVAFF